MAGKSTVIPPKDALAGIDPTNKLSHLTSTAMPGYTGLIRIVMMVVAGNVSGG